MFFSSWWSVAGAFPSVKVGPSPKILKKKSRFGFSRNSNVKIIKFYLDNFCCHKFKAHFLKTSYFYRREKIF